MSRTSAHLAATTSAGSTKFNPSAWNKNFVRAAKAASRNEQEPGLLDSHLVIHPDPDRQLANHVLSKALISASEGEMYADVYLKVNEMGSR
jgi:hypothetical protein